MWLPPLAGDDPFATVRRKLDAGPDVDAMGDLTHEPADRYPSRIARTASAAILAPEITCGTCRVNLGTSALAPNVQRSIQERHQAECPGTPVPERIWRDRRRCQCGIWTTWVENTSGKRMLMDLRGTEGKWVWRFTPDGRVSQWTGSGPGFQFHRCP